MDQDSRILLVEDDLGHARLIQKNLLRFGITNEVIHFSDGSEVMEFLYQNADRRCGTERQSCLMLLDIRMPMVDGIQVLEHVMAHWPAAKVVMITGYAMMEMARSAMEKGAFDFIAKPFSPTDLRTIVARAAKDLGRPLDLEGGETKT